MHQAFLTTMAGGREQLVGLDWGAVAVEPYQVVPLMRVARSVQPRLLIADDTGLGKTAEAGLILRWLAQRHQATRVLILTRAAPEPQRWQRELWTKFGFRFDILANGADFAERRRQSPTVNVFAQEPRMIVSMTLAARQLLLDELRQCPTAYDVVIVDEAHHLAERGLRTKRLSVLGRVLSDKSANGALLLLTATPHDGKTESFLSLLRLLDPLAEVDEGQVAVDTASRLVVRRLKREVKLAGGKEFIRPQIHVLSTLGDACAEEQALNQPLDAYLAWLSAEETRYLATGARQKAKGCQFLATVYRKRFGSSVAALRATLRRRLGLPAAPEDADERVPLVETNASDPEDEIIDPGAEAETPPPPLATAEERVARDLLLAAERVPDGRDSKIEALTQLLGNQLAGEKVVVFTEYRDTLRAAARRLDNLGIRFVTFHGETPEGERDRVIARFVEDPSVQVFLATDAASEGKNLQHAARHLVHLDVPWNPNRYAQRNGRIDRYGQEREPHIWALVAADRERNEGRPEYRALELLVEKLRLIQEQLGSVSPVLPRVSGGSVQDVLIAADAEARVEELLDDPASAKAERDLTLLSVENRAEIRAAEAYVRELSPVDDFESMVGGLLRAAFRGWDDGGVVEPIGEGLVWVRVPDRLRRPFGRNDIKRATFRREVAVLAQSEEDPDAPEFLSPSHPLVELTLRRLRDEASDPAFPHRFDVEVGSPEALVFSFATRFVDGDGRTVEERMEAVEIRENSVSQSPSSDLKRLGIESSSSGRVPDPIAIEHWRERYEELAGIAREEALRRTAVRRAELAHTAELLQDEELQTLARWEGEEHKKINTLVLGTSIQTIPFEAFGRIREREQILEAEHARRRAAIRDRTDIRLASLDLIGGRLYVRGQR